MNPSVSGPSQPAQKYHNSYYGLSLFAYPWPNPKQAREHQRSSSHDNRHTLLFLRKQSTVERRLPPSRHPTGGRELGFKDRRKCHEVYHMTSAFRDIAYGNISDTIIRKCCLLECRRPHRQLLPTNLTYCPTAPI